MLFIDMVMWLPHSTVDAMTNDPNRRVKRRSKRYCCPGDTGNPDLIVINLITSRIMFALRPSLPSGVRNLSVCFPIYDGSIYL